MTVVNLSKGPIIVLIRKRIVRFGNSDGSIWEALRARSLALLVVLLSFGALSCPNWQLLWC